MSTPLTAEEPTTLLDGLAQRERIPGLAAAVAKDGRVVWAGGSGFADLATRAPAVPGTAWHWFSMTKIVTATAVVALADAGRLGLDDPVVQHLPELPAAFGRVRVRHLLEHSAGFRNPLPLRWVHPAGAPLPDQRRLVIELARRQGRPAFEPGSRASYSNVGYLVAGEVVAAVTGRSYVDHVTAEVLQPLQMTSTGFVYTPELLDAAAVGYQPALRGTGWLLRRLLPDGVVGPRAGRFLALNPFELDGPAYGGLIGGVTDAARFVALHASGGELDGVRILSPEAVRAMQRMNRPGRHLDHGLGWFRRPDVAPADLRVVEHLGGGCGFHDLMRLYPDLGVGVVVMANTTRRYPAHELADALAASWRDRAM